MTLHREPSMIRGKVPGRNGVARDTHPRAMYARPCPGGSRRLKVRRMRGARRVFAGVSITSGTATRTS
jgi:hypothetical protein